jgi:hypothetical protein
LGGVDKPLAPINFRRELFQMKGLNALGMVSLFVTTLFTTSVFAQQVSRQEYNLKIKESIADFRNELAQAKDAKAYEAVVSEMASHVIANSDLTDQEIELFESRAATLSDFELKDILISKYDQMIESGSSNFLIFIDAWAYDSSDQHPRRRRGGHPRYPRRRVYYTYHWAAWLFLFPFLLEDTKVSQDI